MADENVAYNGLVVTLADAKTAGLPTYFTGKPCKRGHLAERRVSCRQCVRCEEEFYSKNFGSIQRKRAEYYRENSEKILAKSAAYRAENPAKVRAMWEKWEARNPNGVCAARAKWLAENPEKRAEASAKYRTNNLPRHRATQAKRRAHKRDSVDHHTAQDIDRLVGVQKNRCAHAWCRRSLKGGYEVDHNMPIALGGSNGGRNIQLLCRPCNRRKGAKHPVEWAQENGMLL